MKNGRNTHIFYFMKLMSLLKTCLTFAHNQTVVINLSTFGARKERQIFYLYNVNVSHLQKDFQFHQSNSHRVKLACF